MLLNVLSMKDIRKSSKTGFFSAFNVIQTLKINGLYIFER